MIELNNINKVYKSEGDEVLALKEVTLNIDQGENIVIIGKSGSGKSTLLNIISGIDRPTSGTVHIDSENLNALNENELASWRGSNVGIVFQFYQLLPTLSALDNILFAMNLVNKIPPEDRKEKAVRHLLEVGLESKLKKFPNELSGGERQRVAIARSMANDPLIIIADEPTGNLDSITGKQMEQIFVSLNEKGTTLVTVTHGAIESKAYDRMFHIDDGLVTEYSAAKNLISI